LDQAPVRLSRPRSTLCVSHSKVSSAVIAENCPTSWSHFCSQPVQCCNETSPPKSRLLTTGAVHKGLYCLMGRGCRVDAASSLDHVAHSNHSMNCIARHEAYSVNFIAFRNVLENRDHLRAYNLQRTEVTGIRPTYVLFKLMT